MKRHTTENTHKTQTKAPHKSQSAGCSDATRRLSLAEQHDNCVARYAAVLPEAVDLLMCLGLDVDHAARARAKRAVGSSIRQAGTQLRPAALARTGR